MPTPTVIHQYQYSDSINRRYWDQNYWFDNFQVNPISAAVGGGAATGAAGDLDVLYTAYGQYEYNIIGTQTTTAPELDSFGLNMAMTGTSGQGLEICMGQSDLCPIAFTIGEEAAFFMQAVFTVDVVAGANPLIIGFRKVQAFDATLANYTDFVSIGIVGTTSPNTIQIQTQIATAGVVTTDTTDTVADGDIFQFAIYVDAQGNVTYQLNYEPPTVIAAYQFVTGYTVIPFIRFTETATTCAQASTNYLEVGFQS